MINLQVEFLLFECLQDLTGGEKVFLLGINSLLVDITSSEQRTRKLIMIDAFQFGGKAVGMQLGALVRRTYGWGPVFIMSFGFIVLNFVYVILLVKEKKKPSAKSDTGEYFIYVYVHNYSFQTAPRSCRTSCLPTRDYWDPETPATDQRS